MFAHQSYYEASPSISALWIYGALAVVIVGLLVFFQLLQHQRRITEARLKTAESLAKQGLLSPAELNKLLAPPRLARKFFFFVGWVLMLMGIYFFIMSGFARFDSQAHVMRGIVLCFIATGIFATPFLFRELEKQGLI